MSSDFERDFGEWMTQRMGQLGLRNVDVARALEVSGPAVSLWRTGVNVPENRRVPGLARILQVSPEEVLLRLGRFPSSTDIPAMYQALISGIQDHGPRGQRLFLAAAEALLAERHRAAQIHYISLAALNNPGFSTPEGWSLLWCGSAVTAATLVVLTRPTSEEGTYDISIEGSWEHPPQITLNVGVEPEYTESGTLLYEAVQLQTDWLTLIVEE